MRLKQIWKKSANGLVFCTIGSDVIRRPSHVQNHNDVYFFRDDSCTLRTKNMKEHDFHSVSIDDGVYLAVIQWEKVYEKLSLDCMGIFLLVRNAKKILQGRSAIICDEKNGANTLTVDIHRSCSVQCCMSSIRSHQTVHQLINAFLEQTKNS